MSEINNSKDAWSQFKLLAQKLGGTKNISDADIKELIQKSDLDDDGFISLDEFENTLLTYKDYIDVEDSYLEAFEAIAKEDGDEKSISDKDIESILNSEGGGSAAQGADSSGGNGSNSGGGGPSGGGSGDSPSGVDSSGKQEAVSHSDLESKSADTLQSERGNLLNDISSVRDEKNSAIEQASQKTDSLQTDYNNATQDFADLVLAQEETDEKAKEASDYVKDIDSQKSDKNSEISNQESVINDASALVKTVSSSLSSLQEPPQFITETVTNADGTTSSIQKPNPAYQTYLAQKAALEAELAAAEADLAEQESVLQTLEAELSDIEKAHQEAVDNYCQIKEELGQFTPELSAAQMAIQNSKMLYDKAKSEEATISSNFDSQLSVLQNNLNVYNDVIKQKELSVPEGYSVINGQIVGGEGDNQHVLTPASESDLPEGAKVDEFNVIRDANGVEIGRILGANSSSPQIYIKEVAPIGDAAINMCVDILLNGYDFGDESATQEEIWTDIKGTGLDLTNINSTDLAKIRTLYNEQVERKNAELNDNQEKLKTFDEMAESMLKESKPEYYNSINKAINRAETYDAKQTTFSEYIAEQGVDIAQTSSVVLDEYLNDFIKEQTGSNIKRDLSDEKIDEIVSSFIDGAKQNGEPITAEELMASFDFSTLSSESIAKIVQEYNVKSSTDFLQTAENINIDDNQMSNIAMGLVDSLSSTDVNLLESTNQALSSIIDKSLKQNDTSIIDAIIKSADINLPQVQKFISESDLINKIDVSSVENSLKTQLKEKLSEIQEREKEPEVLDEFNQSDELMAIAHRGFSSEAPENTLAAIELAKAYGYNAVELDISWTKDGIPVLLHDSTIGRTSNAPNNAKCSDMTYQDLLKYDFGSWAGEQFAGTKIPTFSEALDCCADNKLEFFAELKDTKDFDYAKAQKLVQEVIDSGMQENITWISFDKKALSLIDKAMSDANLNSKLGYLSRDSVTNNTINTLNDLKDGDNEVFLDIKASKLTSSGINKLKNAGFEYGVWTVNDAKQILNLDDMGCITITSDVITQRDIERLL